MADRYILRQRDALITRTGCFEGVRVPNYRHLCLSSVCALGRRNGVPYPRPVGGGATGNGASKSTCFYVLWKRSQGWTRRNGLRGVSSRNLRYIGGRVGSESGSIRPRDTLFRPSRTSGASGAPLSHRTCGCGSDRSNGCRGRVVFEGLECVVFYVLAGASAST